MADELKSGCMPQPDMDRIKTITGRLLGSDKPSKNILTFSCR